MWCRWQLWSYLLCWLKLCLDGGWSYSCKQCLELLFAIVFVSWGTNISPEKIRPCFTISDPWVNWLEDGGVLWKVSTICQGRPFFKTAEEDMGGKGSFKSCGIYINITARCLSRTIPLSTRAHKTRKWAVLFPTQDCWMSYLRLLNING